MTGTTHAVRLIGGCYGTVPNRVLGEVLHTAMAEIGPPGFDAEERALARRLQATFLEGAVREALEDLRRRGAALGRPGDPGTELFEGLMPHAGYGESGGGSTDVGDVSHVVPTAQFRAVTAPIGMPSHSWQNVVSVGSTIGRKGMLFAARVLAAAACEVMRQPEVLRRAWEEFRAETAEAPYVSPVRDLDAPVFDA
jgi:aminobenzoyl-glutamate utilization protein B